MNLCATAAPRLHRAMLVAAWLALPAVARGQSSQPASAPTPLSVSLRDALSYVEDYSLTFAQPPVFELLRFVKFDASAPPADASLTADWRVLLERPADFRGAAITVEGPVERCSGWQFENPDYRELGPIWQYQLRVPNQPLTIKVLCTDDVGEIPLGSRMRVAGWFAMIHDYYGPSNRRQHAALLITQRPLAVTPPPPPPAKSESNFAEIAAVSTLALLVGWWLVRRVSPRARSFDPAAIGPSEHAPLNLADDLAQWAEQDPISEDNGAAPKRPTGRAQ